jgi:tetratricopeptide (TPR) repeat protein
MDARDAAIADYETAVRLITEPLDAQHYLRILGQEYDRMAEWANQLGSNTDAKGLSIEAVKIFIDLVNAKPNDPELVLLQSQSRTRLAEVLGELGEDSLAEQHFLEAIAEYEKLREYYATELRYREQFGICLGKYARLLERVDHSDEAIGYYVRAAGHLEAVAQAAPSNENCRHELASCYTFFGDLFRASGDVKQAASMYKKAIALREELLASTVGTPIHNPQRAITLSRQLLDARPKEAAYHHFLGVSYYRAGQWENAIGALEQAAEARLIDDSFDWFYFAAAHHQLGRADQARASYDRALEAMESQRPGNLRLQRLRDEVARLLGLFGHNQNLGSGPK